MKCRDIVSTNDVGRLTPMSSELILTEVRLSVIGDDVKENVRGRAGNNVDNGLSKGESIVSSVADDNH